MLSSPAVYSDGMVASPPLNLCHFVHNSTDTAQFPTAAIWGPVGDMELTHLVGLATLQYVCLCVWQ